MATDSQLLCNSLVTWLSSICLSTATGVCKPGSTLVGFVSLSLEIQGHDGSSHCGMQPLCTHFPNVPGLQHYHVYMMLSKKGSDTHTSQL